MNAVLRLFDSPSRVAFILAAACFALVGTSFYVQHVLDVEPCPLCILQRFTYLALGPVFLAAGFCGTRRVAQRRLFVLAGVLTLAGLGVAGYQTQLQLFPAPIATQCSASLSYMLDTLSVTDLLAQLFHANGDCSDTSFRILGLTMAQGSLLVFSAYAAALGILLTRRSGARSRTTGHRPVIVTERGND